MRTWYATLGDSYTLLATVRAYDLDGARDAIRVELDRPGKYTHLYAWEQDDETVVDDAGAVHFL